MSDWVKRAAVPEDEDALVYLWLKSYAHTRKNVDKGANADRSEAERRYWREHAPIVECLLRRCSTEVLCEPSRVHHEPGKPAVIWAFACTAGDDVVHWVGVKRHMAKAGFGAEMVRALLGARLERPCVFTHELVEMRPRRDRETGLVVPPCGVELPKSWTEDPWWVARAMVGGARAA